MVKYASAFIAMEGGLGSLEELTEVLTLIQTNKTTKMKMYLVDVDYWSGLLEWFKTSMLEEGNINVSDLENIIITYDIDLIVSDLSARYM